MPEEKGRLRRVKATDLYKLDLVRDCALSPNGQTVIYTRQWVDRKSEKRYCNLWSVQVDESTVRQFTFGDQTDGSPAWSPDGKTIAFLSNRRDGTQMQLYLIPADGGEARPLTSVSGSLSGFSWSPDGTRILFALREKDEATRTREADERKKKLGIVARYYDRLAYKSDDTGYRTPARWHLWTVRVKDGRTHQVTDGAFEEREAVWSPDGQQILFVSNHHPDPDANLDETELYLVPAGGGEAVQLETGHHGRKGMPAFSPDGRWIAYLGRAKTGNWWQNTSLYVVPAGGGEARSLTGAADLHVNSVTLHDMGGTHLMTPPTWSPDSSRLYFQVSRRGDQQLLSAALDGTLYDVVVDPGLVGKFSLNKTGERVAYIFGDWGDPGQVWVRDLPDGQPKRLTTVNRKLLARLDLGTLEALSLRRDDGTKLEGWILKPPGFDPTLKYPSILEIHGGPQTQFGRAFMHEFYYLAGRGYVVYFTNPRGSQGFGNDFAGAIYGRWGTVDYDDVMAWANFIQEQPYIDRERLGVTGGSYGGYMTTMIIGRDQRFQAAVAQRVVSNALSMWGSSDLNVGTAELFGLPMKPWEDPLAYWDVSPMKYIGGAKTPTMVIHSERDYRTDREQGEQVYVALKTLGVDAALVLFPDESHGLSRTGRIDRRIERLKHMRHWFDRYL